jgi:hypothetical protein
MGRERHTSLPVATLASMSMLTAMPHQSIAYMARTYAADTKSEHGCLACEVTSGQKAASGMTAVPSLTSAAAHRERDASKSSTLVTCKPQWVRGRAAICATAGTPPRQWR